MHSTDSNTTQHFAASFRSGRATRQIAVGTFFTALFTLVLLGAAHAQTSFTTLHSFKGNGDGYNPIGSLAADSSGALYGTSRPIPTNGGTFGLKVFMLTPPAVNGGSWTNKTIYQGVAGPVIVGPHGELYGDGNSVNGLGFGEIFELVPPSTQGGTWTYKIVYAFKGTAQRDGVGLGTGSLAMDSQGNLYGVTPGGGLADTNSGTVFELSPPKNPGGAWQETVLYKFSSASKNAFYSPTVNPVLGPQGELYGICAGGVYQLKKTNGIWTATLIRAISGKFASQLTADASGNLFGTDPSLAQVFELSPPPPSGGTWTWLLLNFPGAPFLGGGVGFEVAVTPAGSIYGSSKFQNIAYRAVPNGGSWTFTVLHTFLGGSEGARPAGRPVVDSSGRVFGSTLIGGNGPCNPRSQNPGCGTIWELQ